MSVPSGCTCGCALNSAALSLLRLKLTAWPPSPGPAEMPVAQPPTTCGPLSIRTSWPAPAVKPGVSLTAATAIVSVWGALVSLPPSAVPPSSWARTVTVAVPLAFAAGV